MFSIINRLNNKRIRLHEAVYGKDDESTRSGLFGEIREAVVGCQLKGLPDNSKVNFAETYNDVIELEILRHAHEFHITIDKDAVYMVMDDETDSPVEKEISLFEMTEVGQVFAAIREFIESV